MKMFKKETNEERYARYYQKAQIDCDSDFLSMYPRSDPTSPQRCCADNNGGRGAALVAGLVASMFLTPIGGVVVGVLVDEFFKQRD
jgi:hypothetical protein